MNREFDNFEVWETGGGCQALKHETDYGYILITAADGPSLPTAGEDFAVGFYDHDGDCIALDDDGSHRIGFDVGDGVWNCPADTSNADVESFIDAMSARIYASRRALTWRA